MKQFLKAHIAKIILIFLMLQPIIDVLTSICLNVFHVEVTFGVVVRFGFLLFLIFYNYILSKSSKKAKIYLLLITIYGILFVVNVLYLKDFSVVFYEVKNLLRYLYFPLLLVNLYEISKNQDIVISRKKITLVYLIYLLLIIIPVLTNTDFTGYFEGKVGTIGWFHSTNEISAILSGLLPLVFFSSKSIVRSILFLLLTGFVLFSLGSKVTILALAVTALFYLVKWFWNCKQKKKVLGIMVPVGVVLLIASIVLIPKTSFYKNIQIHLDFLEVDSVVDVFKEPELIDHFIFSSRLTFLGNTHSSYVDSNFSSYLLGIGFIENYGTDEVSVKTIEMDIFDIFYRLGILGTILYLLPVFYILKNKIKRSVEQNLAIGIFLFISLMAGHVLTSPAVSIYLVVLLLGFIEEGVVCKQQ